MMKIVVAITGVVIGSAMILTVLVVYYRSQKFALGGTVLTVFGTILIGLSIWVSIEVEISPDGRVQAKFLQEQSESAREKARLAYMNEPRPESSDGDSLLIGFADFALSYGDPIEFKFLSPSLEQIAAAFEETEQSNSFGVVLSRADQDQFYIQAAKFDSEDFYTIEYRDGSPDKHYTAQASKTQALSAFESYLNNTEDYASMFEWEKVEL